MISRMLLTIDLLQHLNLLNFYTVWGEALRSSSSFLSQMLYTTDVCATPDVGTQMLPLLSFDAAVKRNGENKKVNRKSQCDRSMPNCSSVKFTL